MVTGAKIIHRYTRADAITEGVLVDADTAEAGICASAGFRVLLPSPGQRGPTPSNGTRTPKPISRRVPVKAKPGACGTS